MYPNDEQAADMMADALKIMDQYYADRGIFQDRFGFGQKLAIVGAADAPRTQRA